MAHRRIPAPYSGSWSRYQYYRNLSTGIIKLTPETVQPHKLAVTFKKITQGKNSSIPYFKQKILYSDKENHTTCDEPTFPGRNHAENAVPEITEYIIYFIYHRKIYLYANSPSHQISL